MNYWKWSSIAIYISPVLSIISSTLYFGAWQLAFYKVIIATIVGGGIGILVGYSYEMKPLQLVLFFLASLWINKMPGWDRTSMVLGTLAMILGSVWPNLTNGVVLARKSFVSILALQFIPYIITGFSLIFPKTGLATYAARVQAVIICRKLSLMASSTINAFKSYDYLDLHCAEFDQWLTDVRGELASLSQLKEYIKYEKMIFWNVADFPAALSIFVDIAELLVQELIGLQSMVKSIIYNHTQELFVELLTPILVDMNEEMEIALTLVGEYFETFHPFPNALLHIKKNLSHIFWQLLGSKNTNVFSQRRKMKSFYDVPNSKHLIEMQRLHQHEDPLDHKIDYGARTVANARQEDDETRSVIQTNVNGSDLSDSSRPRSLSDVHGFHHYNFVDDIESVSGNRNANLNHSETEAAPTQLHLPGSQSTTPGLSHHNPNELMDQDENTSQSSPKSSSEVGLQQFDECIERLCRARTKLLYTFNEVRRKYIFGTLEDEQAGPYGDHPVPAAPTSSGNAGNDLASNIENESLPPSMLEPSDINTSPRLRRVNSSNKNDSSPSPPLTPTSIKPFTMSQKYSLEVKLTNEIFELDPHRHPHHREDDLFNENYDQDSSDKLSSSLNPPELSIFTSDPQKKRYLILAIREENIRLSLRNLGPRSSYMHRMSILVEYISSLRMVFKEKGTPFSWSKFLYGNAWFLANYVQECALFWWTFLRFWCVTIVAIVQGRLKWQDTKKTVFEETATFLESNTQVIKIASSITLGISIRIFELLPQLYQGGLWVALVMALIRQDNSASSFLTGYQRLEGTVIGAIFAVLISQIFTCATHVCDERLHVPALTIWVLVCAFFREGPQHGYAAVVAAFTPVVLLLSTKASLPSAWGRIFENFIGIAIYLIIDNVFFPKRTYPAIKTLVLKGIDETRVMISESVNAVEVLIGPRVLGYMNEYAAGMMQQQPAKEPSSLTDAHILKSRIGESMIETAKEGEQTVVYFTEESMAPSGGDRYRQNSTGSISPSRHRTNKNQFPENMLGMYGSSTDVRRRAYSCVSNNSSSVAGMPSSAAPLNPNGPTSNNNNIAATPELLSPGIAPVSSSDSHPLEVFEDNFKIVSASSPYSHAPPSNAGINASGSIPANNTNNTMHNFSAANNAFVDISDEDSEIMKEMFHNCTTHLDNAEQQLHILHRQLSEQQTLLSMVVYEPEIFHRPFPLAAYQRLQHAFVRTYRSAVALNSGSRAFAVVFKQMMRNHENVGPYLKNFTYMSKHMFIASAKAEVALRSALDALSMVYSQRDFHAELTSLLTLRRVCDRLIQSVDDHFRSKYLRQSVDILTKFNPYFIVAWQNVFESTSDMIRDLSELGMALLIVRNAEALSYV
jgi:hypothetical protein